MRRWLPFLALAALLLAALAALILVRPASHTHLQLADADTGRQLLATVLSNGEPLTLTWQNSIFQLPVVEVFYAADGILILDQVAFLDPEGIYQMPVTPADVKELYHTGGPFSTAGLARPYQQVIFRLGEIGNPKITTQGKTVALKDEVGFGGRVRLDARRACALEVLLSH
jgi:hypothetical protein